MRVTGILSGSNEPATFGRGNAAAKQLLGREYELTKKEKGKYVRGEEKHKALKEPFVDEVIATAEVIAKAHGVSRETVKRAGKIARVVDELEEEGLAYSIRTNKRRNLTTGQHATIASENIKLYASLAGVGKHGGARGKDEPRPEKKANENKAAKAAATAMGVSASSVEKATRLKKESPQTFNYRSTRLTRYRNVRRCGCGGC